MQFSLKSFAGLLFGSSCCLWSADLLAAAPADAGKTLVINNVASLAAPTSWQQPAINESSQQLLRQQQLQAFKPADLRNWQQIPLAAAVSKAGWLQLNLHASRYDRLTLNAAGFTFSQAWLDGVSTASNGEIALTPGDHQLLLWAEPAAAPDSLQLQSQFPLQLIDQPRRLTEARLQQLPQISELELSPDGQFAIVGSSVINSAGEKVRQLQLRRSDNQQVLQHWAQELPTEWLFSPDSRSLVYVQQQQLHQLDLTSGAHHALPLPANLSLQRFLADGRQLVVQFTQSQALQSQQLKHLRKPDDRFMQSRDVSQLMLLNLADGSLQPLPALPADSSLADISPDQQQWLIQSHEANKTFPFGESSVLSLYTPASAELRRLGQFRLLDQALFADNDHLWIVAGPNFADGAGKVLSADRTANDYDGQLYRYRLKDGVVEARSRDFAPGIIFMYPQRQAGRLLLWVTDQAHNRLYSYDVRQQRFALLQPDMQHVEMLSAADSGAVLYVQSGAQLPPQLIYQRKQQQQVWQDQATMLTDSAIATVHDLQIPHPAGHQIPAHYYLPADFDAAKKYPLIVYYYGGTIPESKKFAGPYPFQQWAAAGYLVLVVQPRGAVGYGQDYSAWHPNDWGKAAGDDILHATSTFLQLQPAADKTRIGHIGASYGGFMTMYLASHSRMFKAGVAHAGISTLSSYWGQGQWGIGYSQVASAGSYPWNNPSMYTSQSPLFHADKVKEALLLTAGDADNNVPYGESIQMYNALKLLGKPVEMVSVPGEGHSIRDPLKRRQWLERIQAFFDWHLKDQPQWWQALEKQS